MTEGADTARRIGVGRAWPRRAPVGERVAAAFVGACFLGVLVVAAWLRPASGGVGTHEQLGLEPCVWLSAFGTPCPTCGMTTAFSHAAHGSPLASFRAQPLGAVLALGAAVGFWIALHVAVTGSNAGRTVGFLFSTRGVVLGVGGLIGAWVYKMLTFGG